MPRSVLIVGLALLMSVGTAAATAPIPYIEKGVDYDTIQVGHVRSGYMEKPDPVGEQCVRHLLCAGPFFPHIEYDFGTTGALVRFDDTNVSAGHDPEHEDEYGPYVLPSLIARDDIRFCWRGCAAPMPVFLHARTNVTVQAWAVGPQRVNYTLTPHLDVEEPNVLPDTFGCSFSNYGCDGDHAMTIRPPRWLTSVLP